MQVHKVRRDDREAGVSREDRPKKGKNILKNT